MKKIFEYSFKAESWASVIVLADSKSEARELIDKVCIDNEMKRPVSGDEIEEMDVSDGIIYVKTGEYVE